MKGEVLVAVITNWADMEIAQKQHWYRIPVEQLEKLKQRHCCSPEWLAFYQTKEFGEEAYQVIYYARVKKIIEVSRGELFPDQPQNDKSQKRYYKLELSALKRLAKPIISKRLRRITFIPTTWGKFTLAKEINDLWDESPLEDRLWEALKRLNIDAERQEHIKVKENDYMLDFAIYCMKGVIDVETDGDTWHTNKAQVARDNVRENDLKTSGWCTLRFNTQQVNEQLAEYCVPTIVQNIHRLGGLSSRKPSLISGVSAHSTDLYTDLSEIFQQLTLFDWQGLQNTKLSKLQRKAKWHGRRKRLKCDPNIRQLELF